MHLYSSWRKLKNCIVKMIPQSANKANKDIFFCPLYMSGWTKTENSGSCA